MAFMVPIKGEPGVFFIPSLGRKIKIVEFREDNKYDTVVLAAAAVTDGLQKFFFRDLTNKVAVDTNFKTPRRIGQGEEMIIKWVGLQVEDACGNTPAVSRDVKKILWGSFFEFKVDGVLVTEGTSIYYPSGYGLAGQSTENDSAIVASGVPATASVRVLEKPHQVGPDNDLEGLLTFQDHLWDATNLPTTSNKTYIRCTIHGIIRKGATRGT